MVLSLYGKAQPPDMVRVTKRHLLLDDDAGRLTNATTASGFRQSHSGGVDRTAGWVSIAHESTKTRNLHSAAHRSDSD